MSHEANLEYDLKLNAADIDEEITRQPGLYAYYAAQYHELKKAADRAKISFDVYESSLQLHFRAQYASRKEKITNDHLTALIQSVPEWMNRRQELIELEAQAAQLKDVLEAVKQKKDMIVTFCANARNEYASPFNMREKSSMGSMAQRDIPLVNKEE